MRSGDEPLVAQPVGAETAITLGELCRVFEIHAEELIELVDHGVAEPFAGSHPADWRFPAQALVRVRRALRLREDLAVDPAGAALALDLIEELHRLRARLAALDPASRGRY